MAAALLTTSVGPAAGAAAPASVNTAAASSLAAEIEGESSPISFADTKGHFAQQAVESLAKLQLIQGDGSGLYHPNQPISRQDFAILFAKTAGLLPIQPKEARFADIAADGPYAPYVESLAAAGLMRGRTDSLFGAAAPIKRQELAVLLSRFMTATGSDPQSQEDRPVSFADAAEIAAYAQEAVAKVSAKQWMRGSGGRFQPNGQVTRGEAAVIMDRLLAERVKQAENAAFRVNADKLTLLAGETRRLEVSAPDGSALPFTPVFAFDRPELGTVLGDGTFIAGPKAGTGQVTVTVGYRRITIPVEITADGGSSEEAGGTAAPLQEEGLTNYAPDSFYAVRTTGPADSYFHSLEKNYPGPVGGLVTPSETWTGYARQFGREITLALPGTKTVERVLLSFKQDKKQGIYLPPEMEVEVSKDGKTWHYGGKATHSVPASEETPVIRTLAVSLPSVDVRYVRVRFPVQIFVFARQLQVLGSESHGNDVKPVFLAPVQATAALMDKKAEDRMQNMLLAYSGAYAERGTWTKEDFLPLVGYMSPDGKVLDRMFDSILFLPYPNLPSTKEGWEHYLDDLFSTQRQLYALNDAMIEYNKRRGTLYTDPVVEKVVLTIPYPDVNQGNFGKLLENQDSLSFQPKAVGEERSYRYRKQALDWYFQKLLQRWRQAEFKYLKLEGIYWYKEMIDDAVPGERQLIRETAEMVHNQALRFYWIPYFGATGLSEWKALGFDYAFIQPNFYNDKEIPVDRIETTLKVANQYGMGVEVEGDERMVRDMRYYQIYYNQLIAGHKLGIDKEKVHAYYYGSKSLLEAFKSKEPQGRAIYDDTYQWMRGRFTRTEYLVPKVEPVPAPSK
ncbi:DUF4855 domain-containing protein [Brevibacillus sp. SYP-B805]|nr:DUF4855 domain-containing protein [Brevibacillus sp. SYP-B805]